MRKTLIALVALVALAIAGGLVAAPRTTNDPHRASVVSGVDIFDLTQRARDLPNHSYPTH
jgi:hypothetical protein